MRNPNLNRCTCIYIHIYFTVKTLGLPWWLSSKESVCQCRLNPWVGKIPWRKWQSTPVFLLGKFHGQRSLVGYSPWGCTRVGQDWASVCTRMHACTRTHTWTLPPFLSISRDSLAIKRMVSFPVGILFSKGDFLLFKYTLMQTRSCQHLESHPVASCPAPLSVKLWCRHFRGKSHLSVSLVKWFLSWSLKSSPSAHCCPSTVFHMQISTVRGV